MLGTLYEVWTQDPMWQEVQMSKIVEDEKEVTVFINYNMIFIEII